jgi:hypothetical protein
MPSRLSGIEQSLLLFSAKKILVINLFKLFLIQKMYLGRVLEATHHIRKLFQLGFEERCQLLSSIERLRDGFGRFEFDILAKEKRC